MDKGDGTFEDVGETELYGIMAQLPCLEDYCFCLGDEITIKGSRFIIDKIQPKKLTLRLLPKKEKASV